RDAGRDAGHRRSVRGAMGCGVSDRSAEAGKTGERRASGAGSLPAAARPGGDDTAGCHALGPGNPR
ncbi:MAG: hypothetical protein ACRYHA_15510, partial [Janthinobacterium lividum]